MVFKLEEEITWKGKKARLVECHLGNTGIYGIYVTDWERRSSWDDEVIFEAVAPALLKSASLVISKLSPFAPTYPLVVDSLVRQAIDKLKKEIEAIPHA